MARFRDSDDGFLQLDRAILLKFGLILPSDGIYDGQKALSTLSYYLPNNYNLGGRAELGSFDAFKSRFTSSGSLSRTYISVLVLRYF